MKDIVEQARKRQHLEFLEWKKHHDRAYELSRVPGLPQPTRRGFLGMGQKECPLCGCMVKAYPVSTSSEYGGTYGVHYCCSSCDYEYGTYSGVPGRLEE